MKNLPISPYFIMIGTLIILLNWIFPVQAERITSLFTTPKACRVGDTVTIIISEFSTASQTAKTDFGKGDKLSTKFTLPQTGKFTLPQTGKFTLPQIELPETGWEYSSSYDGSGSTQHRGSLSAKITAEVVEVLPNGNLRIKGKREIEVNQEKQIIYIEGIVRPDDIGRNNTVYSMNIAQAKIKYEGIGAINEAQRPGILSRLFHWLRIF